MELFCEKSDLKRNAIFYLRFCVEQIVYVRHLSFQLSVSGILNEQEKKVLLPRLSNIFIRKNRIATPTKPSSRYEWETKKWIVRAAGVILWNSVVDCNRDNNSQFALFLLLHSLCAQTKCGIYFLVLFFIFIFLFLTGYIILYAHIYWLRSLFIH